MKNNQKANRSYRTASKTLSFMLAVVLIAGMLIPVGYADSTGTGEPVTLNSEDASAQVEEIPFELPLLPGDLSPEEAKTAELDMSTVPDEGGHFITVIGYDSVSGYLVFSDCSYVSSGNRTNFGIYLVSCSALDLSGSVDMYVAYH